MQIEYKMEGFLHLTEKCPNSGDVLLLVGKETEQNCEQCPHQINIQIPLQNSATLQHCVYCVEGIVRNAHREGCGSGRCPHYSVCKKLGTQSHPGSSGS